jgi:hypothetical protein
MSYSPKVAFQKTLFWHRRANKKVPGIFVGLNMVTWKLPLKWLWKVQKHNYSKALLLQALKMCFSHARFYPCRGHPPEPCRIFRLLIYGNSCECMQKQSLKSRIPISLKLNLLEILYYMHQTCTCSAIMGKQDQKINFLIRFLQCHCIIIIIIVIISASSKPRANLFKKTP